MTVDLVSRVALVCAALGVATAAAAVEPLPSMAPQVGEPVAALPVLPYAGTAVPTQAHWSVLTQDITLEHTLQRWGVQAGVRIKWDARRNFLIGASDSVDGTFETALKTVLGSAGIRQSDYPLEACIYANNPPLVRITRQGEQARECDAQ